MIKCFCLAFFFAGLLAAIVPAQPTGREPREMRMRAEALQKQIADISDEIKKYPRVAEKYERRGQLYTELYVLLYQSYLSTLVPLEQRLAEPSKSVLADLAIADYTRAIKVSPSAELYRQRAQMFSNQWYADPDFGWGERIKAITDPEWQDLVNWDDPEKERRAFGEFVNYKPFTSMVNDYTAALELDPEPAAKRDIHSKLGRLYMTRVGRIPFDMSGIRNLVLKPNPLHYSFWADIDTALKHYRAALKDPLDTTNEIGVAIRKGYLYKANQASAFGEYQRALDTFSAGEEFFQPATGANYDACRFFTERARVYVKLRNFDAAIAEATRLIETDTIEICHMAYEPRADSYLARGDYRAAMADYDKIARLPTAHSEGTHYIYRNRAIARLALGDAEKSVSDLFIFFNYSGNGDVERTPDDYALYAEACRKAGKDKLARELEWQMGNIKTSIENMARSRVLGKVYGKVLMPDGTPVKPAEIATIALLMEGNNPLQYSPSFDEKGRFLFYDVENKPFTLFAYVREKKDGVAVSYGFKTGPMIPKGRVTGPIVIKLRRMSK